MSTTHPHDIRGPWAAAGPQREARGNGHHHGHHGHHGHGHDGHDGYYGHHGHDGHHGRKHDVTDTNIDRPGRQGRRSQRWETRMEEPTDDRRDPRGSRARGRRGGRGPEGFGPGLAAAGPDFGPGFGPGGFGPGFGPGHGGRSFGRRGGGRRGGRGGRGDVRAAILLLLESQPMHGYELIQQIADKTGGVWTPSPGSIYPALQQLEDEGLLAFERVEGRKTATLTDQGRAYVEEHRSELGAPWDDVSGGVSGEARELRALIGALMGAVHTVAHVGTREQVSEASKVLVEARKSLYRILAEDSSDS